LVYGGKNMAQVSINISVESIAGIINNMDVKEIETLCILLSDEGQGLLKRKKEAEAKDCKFLSRDEAFDI
jgi:hypothetical protein